MSYVLVSDFDGTISFDDFFNYVADKYFDDEMLRPWREYIAGQQTHFNALHEMFLQINEDKDKFDAFIKTIKTDPKFVPTLKLCQQKNIPVYIVSAGCDYYIKIILGDLLNNIMLITNSATYSKQSGLVMKALPENSPYYNSNVGISKKSVVEMLHKKGYKVIFAGDGPPDIEPAEIADVVFAKKILLSKCQELGIKTQKFETYQDIYDYIKEL